MSFGYSIGDFLTILKLANDVTKRFVNAPAQFAAISEDVKRLSNVLRDIDDIEPEQSLSDRQKQRLNEVSQGCGSVLAELKDVLDIYQELDWSYKSSMGGATRRVWKKLKWNPCEIDEYRQRLDRSIDTFVLFLSRLNMSAIRRVLIVWDETNKK